MQEYISPLGYLHDTPPGTLRKDSILLRVGKIKFNPEIVVKKQKDLFIPLIAVNFRKTKMEIQTGERAFRKSYREFVTESFFTEGSRSGNFFATRDTVINGYTLVLQIDSCLTKTLYNRTYFSIFLDLTFGNYFSFTYRSEKRFPCMAFINGTASLWKGDSLIMQKKYEVRKIQNYYPSDIFRYSLIYDYIDRCRFLAMRNMSEGLSLATKDLTDQVISDVNKRLRD